jgi:hypothetical protein
MRRSESVRPKTDNAITPPIRLLLAVDESPGSERARDLVRGLRLMPGSAIRVIGALGPEPSSASLPLEMERDLIAAAMASLQSNLALLAEPLRAPEIAVESDARRGRAASVIVQEAEGWSADLVVLGSRGRGGLASTVLGSVAAEVIDHSPCAVLVARSASVRSIVLADDGSADALAARDIVASRLFGGEVTVVSVAHAARPLSSGIAPTVRSVAAEVYRQALAASRQDHQATAEHAAEALRGAGLHATVDVRVGDPAEEVVAAAKEKGADLIAMGTRGRTGLQRLLLGSVARAVLYGSHCSVLVARASRD